MEGGSGREIYENWTAEKKEIDYSLTRVHPYMIERGKDRKQNLNIQATAAQRDECSIERND